MTTTHQDFEMYQGDTQNIIIPVIKKDGNPLVLTGCTVKWGLRVNNYKSNNLIFKQSPEIEVVNNEIVIRLLPEDTTELSGSYYHECELTDAQGNVSTIFVGTAYIRRSNV